MFFKRTSLQLQIRKEIYIKTKKKELLIMVLSEDENHIKMNFMILSKREETEKHIIADHSKLAVKLNKLKLNRQDGKKKILIFLTVLLFVLINASI